MPILVNVGRCPQDHRCPAVRACPVGALSQEAFRAPRVDEGTCVDCGRCALVCPQGALVESQHRTVEA